MSISLRSPVTPTDASQLARELASLYSIIGDDPALEAWVHQYCLHGVPRQYAQASSWWEHATEEQQWTAWTILGFTDQKPEQVSPDDRYRVPNAVINDLRAVAELIEHELKEG